MDSQARAVSQPSLRAQHSSGSSLASSSSSSRAATPTGAESPTRPTSQPSIFGLFTGLVRRFSTEMPAQPSSSHPPSTLHHAATFAGTSSAAHNNGIDGVYTPPKMTRQASPMRPPPLEPLVLSGFREDTPAEARLLTPAIAEEIRIMVPARLGIVDEWNLVYSLDQDGASLATLYEKCGRYDGRRVGFVLVVKDCEGGIFGAYLSDHPHPSPKYFGTGECFLWRASVMASLPPPPSSDTTNLGRTTTISAHTPPPTNNDDDGGNTLKPTADHVPKRVDTPHSIRFKAFPYSGVNEYYLLCEPHFLSVGAGDGRYGLWLDNSLEMGHSDTCLTFGNERLSDEGEKFGILGVEVWVIGAEGPR